VKKIRKLPVTEDSFHQKPLQAQAFATVPAVSGLCVTFLGIQIPGL